MYLSQATEVITRSVPRGNSLEPGVLSLESKEVVVVLEKREWVQTQVFGREFTVFGNHGMTINVRTLNLEP